MPRPIIDLHCDLLAYLVKSHQRTPFDNAARAALPQLKQGGVCLQTLPLFCVTSTKSIDQGRAQALWLQRLYRDHADLVCNWHKNPINPESQEADQQIRLLPAIENASGFCDEDEPIETGFKRLEEFITLMGRPLYISMTWNDENRFGGGNVSDAGLKEDGKRLLEYMHKKKIAIDFSHTSDNLARDILDHLDKAKLEVPLIASHSNYRMVFQNQRNLADDVAKELFRRDALVGINFVSLFIGSLESDFVKHIKHAIGLGGATNIALGADFFCTEDIPEEYKLKRSKKFFFENFDNATCYRRFFDLIKKDLFEEEIFENLAYKNALSWIQRNIT